MAKEIQAALKRESLPPGVKWPCCQRFLTGDCDASCNTCTRAGAPVRGDKPARDVAAKVLARLVKEDRLATDCATSIRAGEGERA